MIKNSDNKVFMVLATVSLIGNAIVMFAASFPLFGRPILFTVLPVICCVIAITIKLSRKIDMTYYLNDYGLSWGMFLIFFILYGVGLFAARQGTILFLLVTGAVQLILIIIQSVYLMVKHRKSDVWLVLFLSNPALHLLINFGVALFLISLISLF